MLISTKKKRSNRGWLDLRTTYPLLAFAGLCAAMLLSLACQSSETEPVVQTVVVERVITAEVEVVKEVEVEVEKVIVETVVVYEEAPTATSVPPSLEPRQRRFRRLLYLVNTGSACSDCNCYLAGNSI